MFDPRDPRQPEEMRYRGQTPYGPDSSGREMLRSLLVLGIIVIVVLAGLWLVGR